MSIYEAFKTDPTAEADGITLDFGEFKVMIGRAGGANKKYESALRKKLDRYKRAIQFEALPEATARKVLIEVFAETVVKGWEGIQDEAGLEISFSVDACVKLFTDLPEFFEQVREEAQKVSNFLLKRRQTNAGN